MKPISRIACSLLAAAFLIGFYSICFSDQRSANRQVYIVRVAGEIDPAMTAFLKRALRDIPDTPESLIVIEMDTFGGRVDSALKMVDAILNVNQAHTIAYVKNKAISAGALISLACNQLVMQNNTTIGDCAPITFSSEEGPKMLGEKFQSPLRAKFRTLAKKNGYPAVLAESMVTIDMQVYRIKLDGKLVYMDDQQYRDLPKARKDRIELKETVVAKGELLTMDDSEAKDLGFSSMSVKSINDMLAKMDIADPEITTIEQSWSEQLVSFIGMLSPILMLIGLGALYTEIKAPGFGVPGIIGIACLALVLFNQHLVGLADHTELLIILVGLILMGFELFVFPGFGFSGIAGIICITAGMLLSLQDFVIPDPQIPWEKDLLIHNLLKVLSAVLGAFLVALFVLRYVLPRLSKTVQGPYLATTLAGARHDTPMDDLEIQTGHTGTALTFLRPSGKAKIDGEVYDVVSQAEFIEKGTPVRVVKIKGAKITVERVNNHA